MGEQAVVVVVERIRDCLLITGAGEAEEALRRFAGAAPSDPTTVTVLIGANGLDARAVMSSLPETLGRVRDEGYGLVRLLVSDAGRESTGDGSSMQELADAIGVAVLAPVGSVLQVPGGTLFPTTETGAGTWQRFNPGGRVAQDLGPWDLAVGWRAHLAAVPLGARPGLSVHAVPAGLALLPELAGSTAVRPLPADDVTYCVPVDHRRPLVIVTGQHGPAIAQRQIAAFLTTLPAQVRDDLRLIPCGLDLDPDVSWGQEIADLLGAEVRALAGVPLLVGDQTRVGVLAQADGSAEIDVAGWEPFAVTMSYQPTGVPRRRIARPKAPVAQPVTADAAQRRPVAAEALPTVVRPVRPLAPAPAAASPMTAPPVAPAPGSASPTAAEGTRSAVPDPQPGGARPAPGARPAQRTTRN